jgi:threonine/homoserine/homoserine lactone efflux protein
MGNAIGAILGQAVGVAISPVPIIAVILMLFSKAAKVNSISFLVGWIVGLLGAGMIVLAIGISSSDGAPSTASGWIKIAIGALFLGLGVKQWTSRPKKGETAAVPGWMSSIDSFTAAKAFGMGVLLSAVNPKNLGLTIAAAATIGGSGLSSGDEIIVMVVFVLIASLTVAAPVILNLVMGSKATHTLTEMKEWLTDNNATEMSVLFVVLGAKVLGAGISIVA